MLRIAFCASLYNKTDDFNLLAELIARHQRECSDTYQIDLLACSTAEDVDAVVPKMSRFNALVPYRQPRLYDGEERDYVITRKVFHCIRQMLAGAHQQGYDFAVFVHSDVYPLDFSGIAAIIETMRRDGRLIAARGEVTPKMGMWMDDNILFFDMRIATLYPEMLELERNNDLTKPMFQYGIHHILPFWMMRYLAPEEFYFFSDCSKNIGYEGRPQGAQPTPLSYDPDLKILHANNHGYWAGEGEAPIISAVKQRIFFENGNTGEPGSETATFLATKYKYENPTVRRVKNKIRQYIPRRETKAA